ncbi:S8 family serine peptidase [Nitrososphaera sp.]|uniref:S8 family serine peptidase n=1 Tax=Nitrososphaera sp. TaxID=1971748 RepID=UPI00307DC743
MALVGSMLVAPAYSLSAAAAAGSNKQKIVDIMSGAAESRPLTSLVLPPSTHSLSAAGPDAVSIFGYAVPRDAIKSDFGAIDLGSGLAQYNGSPRRTLVFGPGNPGAIATAGSNVHLVGLGSSPSGGFLGVAMSKNPLPPGTGFSYAADMPLTFDSKLSSILANYTEPIKPGRLSGASIIGADRVRADYGITGRNVTIAIVDTGTDFSNDDMRHAVARDRNGVPIMLDADGHGIVLTRAKYIANIDQSSGRIMNYSSSSVLQGGPLPHNATSYVYVNATGVYLKTSQGKVPVYNTLYPYFGPPVLDGTATVDWKIGNSATDYIRSKSGVYRMGVQLQVSVQFGTLTLVLVPVLVVDSEKPGAYDTIVADMSYAWYSFTIAIAGAYPGTNHLIPPKLTFDYTDETPFKIGGGNEFLTYDYNRDGFADFSAGTAGARVLDIWRVIDNKTRVVQAGDADSSSGMGYAGAISARLLEPMDPAGEYVGVMFDFQGHGTSTAATVASKGEAKYDIYSNSTKYRLAGMAPDAKIIPVKALWAGDALYGWLYASGFEPDYNDNNNDGKWRYTGEHKADIISNSWGISNFPLLKYGPGFDLLSVFSSLLVVPGLLADGYPGTVMVDSAGNNGVGYGSVATPNVSPFSISVGATTNNVHLQYGPFANITRFGSSAAAFDDVAEFSSRGPGLIGDPKPDIMAVGSYGFTPTAVTAKNLEAKKNDANNDGAFSLFGGTSMAAPMVAGAAALVAQELKEGAGGKPADPFEVKRILMASAKDLKNDPFVQGAGRVDALAAVELARGKTGRFSMHTTSTAENVLSVMAPALYAYNSTLGIIEGERLSSLLSLLPAATTASTTSPTAYPSLLAGHASLKDSRWFAGYIEQGGSSSTRLVIENPSKEKDINVELSSTIEKLVARYEVSNTTKLFVVDPTHKEKQFGYAPNYYNLTKVAGGKIPPGADLMVARVNFPFNSFLNSTELFADHLRIASVYAYDWRDADGDGKVEFKETTLINRGGSWGTTQEVRVGEPVSKFKGTPLIGVYPVPSVFSFWRGDRHINSTSMNYTLTVELYKRMPNPDVEIEGTLIGGDKAFVSVPAGGSAGVSATVNVSDDALSGVYYGEIVARSREGNRDREMVMPVSYVVTTRPVPKDVPVVISPPAGGSGIAAAAVGGRHGPEEIETALGLRPNGYVGGLSDMTSRYSAGDWRSYYFSVKDPTITSMNLKVSWPHNSTSINAMAYGPDGRMVASSVPAGVFQEFAGWASNDWLGTSSVSEGGAFYFGQNNGANSTVLSVPINGTGIYSVLMHNTLFHGESLYESVIVEAKFSTLLPDSEPPRILASVPEFVTGVSRVPVKVDDENAAGVSYSIDGIIQQLPPPDTTRGRNAGVVIIDGKGLTEGRHTIIIESSDTVGHSSSLESAFIVDRTPPSVVLAIGNSTLPQEGGNSKIYVSSRDILAWNATDANGVSEVKARIPGLEVPIIKSARQPAASAASSSASSPSVATGGVINSTGLADGQYKLLITMRDVPGNGITKRWDLVVDNAAPAATLGIAGEVSGTTKIAIGAQDGSGVKSAVLRVGNTVADVTGIDSYVLDTTFLPDGEHEATLTVADPAGNESTASAKFMVANVRPVIVMVALLGVAGGVGAGFIIARIVASRRG